MKRILSYLTVCGLLLLWACPLWASTYTQVVTASFGTALTGQATNVRITVYDYSGMVQIAATNMPSGNAISETTDAAGNTVTGTYATKATIDTSWLPIRCHWTIVGQAGVAADAVIGSERAQAVADGLSSATIANINSGATSAGTAATQSTTAATQATSAATSAATAATQSSSANTQATAANGKLLGNVAAQTGDAYALLGTRVPNVLPTFPTNFSLFTIDGTGKTGANNLPTDYTRNNVAPTWYTAGGDPWMALLTNETTAGTFGAFVKTLMLSASYAAPPSTTQIQTYLDANSTQLALIVANQVTEATAVAANGTAIGGLPASLLASSLGSSPWNTTTVSDALKTSWAGYGKAKVTIVGNLMTIYAPDNTTIFKQFTITPVPTASSRQ